MQTTTVGESAQALFEQMTARADARGVLPISGALMLAIERRQAGEPEQAEAEIAELLAAGWVAPYAEGGWDLFEGMLSLEVSMV